MDCKLRDPGGPTKVKPKRIILCTGTVRCHLPQLLRITLSSTANPYPATMDLQSQRGIKPSLLEHAN